MTRPPARRTALAAVAALGLLAAACGTPGRPIGIKEYPGDVVFGDQALPPPPTIPPAADPVPAFPGFIAPPAPREQAFDAPPTTRPRPLPTIPVAACPEDDPLAVPGDEAVQRVPGPPKPATLPFRVSGTSKVGTTTVQLPPLATHKVSGPTSFGQSIFRFDVAVSQFGGETVTTYQVDQSSGGQAVSGLTSGNAASNVSPDNVAIVQIRTADQVATNAFTPSAPIRILPLPPVKGLRFTGAGSDPLHGTSITIHGTIVGKSRVNACGTPIEAWQVRVGVDPQTGQPSTITSPTKRIVLTGTYSVATQFGGLIVADDLVMEGTESGQAVRIAQRSATNTVPARP